MKTRNIATAATLGAILLTQGACAVRPAQTLPAEYDASDTLALLNSGTDTPTPGVIHELSTTSSTALLNVLGGKPLYEPAGWILRSATGRPSIGPIGSRNIGAPLVECTQLSWWQRTIREMPCDVPTPVTVELHIVSSASEVLLEPMSLIEILNRPVTGLAYNREAESRIQLWRSSLASTLYKARGNGAGTVSLCVAREQTTDATVTVTGRIDARKAASLATEVLAASSVRIDPTPATEQLGAQSNGYAFRVISPMTVAATFRDVQLVDGAIDTRIDFSLTGTRSIFATVFRAVEDPVVNLGARK